MIDEIYGIDAIAADLGNAYLNTPVHENLWC